jgi:hypothetical protein
MSLSLPAPSASGRDPRGVRKPMAKLKVKRLPTA